MARRVIDQNPQVFRRRANFNLSHRVATTLKVGYLTPIDIVEVLPGDTWTVKPASLTRLSTTFIRPLMDDIYLDTYSFFVPLRLCYDQLEQVFGDSSPSAYTDPELAQIPYVPSVASGTDIQAVAGGVADYLGLPPTTAFQQGGVALAGAISLLPFRAFALIKNEYFTVQGIEQPVQVNTGESSMSECLNGDAWSPTNYTGLLPQVRRYSDYFSTCLPAPQKGASVRIPGFDQYVPVSTTQNRCISSYNGQPLQWLAGSALGSAGQIVSLNGQVTGTTSNILNTFPGNAGTTPAYANPITPANLWALNSSVDDATIQSLRTAFQLQKYLERDALYGSRYREYLYAAYGVVSPDSRLQIPEFLAGAHNRLNISQIPSMTSDSDYEVGQYAANVNSLSQRSGAFSKSFTEHGYIITVACIRYKHLYSQSINRLWRRFDRSHFYDPLFANLGQQAVYTRDVYGIGIPGSPNQVLGYQEAFAEYRTIPDRVSGQMRPEAGNIGQYWSLADRFDSAPTLLDLTMEDDTSFERVISATSSVVDPFVVDFNFQCSVARVVSPFGVPGLADHH